MHLPMPIFYTPKVNRYIQTLSHPLPHSLYIIDSMKTVPLYDSDENMGSAPLTTNLDTRDGIRRHATRRSAVTSA